MPLFYISDNIKEVTHIPHNSANRPIINRIPQNEYNAIVKELNRRIGEVVDSPKELITSGWIPGNDWTGTVWEPIYHAAHCDSERAGMVFGAIVFEVMMNREEDWSLGKYQVDGRDIGSTTYFRINRK